MIEYAIASCSGSLPHWQIRMPCPCNHQGIAAGSEATKGRHSVDRAGEGVSAVVVVVEIVVADFATARSIDPGGGCISDSDINRLGEGYEADLDVGVGGQPGGRGRAGGDAVEQHVGSNQSEVDGFAFSSEKPEMPRYFFNLQDGTKTQQDVEGVELPNVSSARDEAIETLAQRAMNCRGMATIEI